MKTQSTEVIAGIAGYLKATYKIGDNDMKLIFQAFQTVYREGKLDAYIEMAEDVKRL